MMKLRILGSAGHAREVAALATAVDESRTDIQFIDVDDEAAALAQKGDVALGMGSPKLRLAVTERWGGVSGLTWPTLVHPRAQVGPRGLFGVGVAVQTNVVATTDVSIDDFSYINFSATLGHDVRIGRCCLINPSASLSGGVTIGDGVLVGVGAVILENLSIGDGATIGAGAVVVRDVAAGSTVVGVPAEQLGGPT